MHDPEHARLLRPDEEVAQAGKLRRTAGPEGAVPNLLVVRVAGPLQVHQRLGVGQCQIPLLGELSSRTDVVGQAAEHGEHGRLARRGQDRIVVRQGHGRQGRPAEPRRDRRPGKNPPALLLRPGVEPGDPLLGRLRVGEVHTVGRGRREQRLGHPELGRVPHRRDVTGGKPVDCLLQHRHRGTGGVQKVRVAQEPEQRLHRGREPAALLQRDAQLAGTPLQQELGQLLRAPAAEVPVAVAPLPVERHRGIGDHLGRLPGRGADPFDQPSLELLQEQPAPPLEPLLVAGTEAHPHVRSFARDGPGPADPGASAEATVRVPTRGGASQAKVLVRRYFPSTPPASPDTSQGGLYSQCQGSRS